MRSKFFSVWTSPQNTLDFSKSTWLHFCISLKPPSISQNLLDCNFLLKNQHAENSSKSTQNGFVDNRVIHRSKWPQNLLAARSTFVGVVLLLPQAAPYENICRIAESTYDPTHNKLDSLFWTIFPWTVQGKRLLLLASPTWRRSCTWPGTLRPRWAVGNWWRWWLCVERSDMEILFYSRWIFRVKWLVKVGYHFLDSRRGSSMGYPRKKEGLASAPMRIGEMNQWT